MLLFIINNNKNYFIKNINNIKIYYFRLQLIFITQILLNSIFFKKNFYKNIICIIVKLLAAAIQKNVSKFQLLQSISHK